MAISVHHEASQSPSLRHGQSSAVTPRASGNPSKKKSDPHTTKGNLERSCSLGAGLSAIKTASSGCIFLNPIWRIIMKVTSKSGAVIAAAAATLFLAGMTISTNAQAADGHCMGANACKGQSACKGGKSPGPGANACKGMGFAVMSKGDCVAAKGKFKPA
jgi:hypothetical protein